METSLPAPECVPAPGEPSQPSQLCARVFEQEFSFLYWTFRRYGVRPAEAEDLAQEAFVVLWRRRNDLIPGRPVRPWLAGVAFHLATKHLARRGRESTGGHEVVQDIRDRAPLPDEGLAAARERAVAEEVFAYLPERHRQALQMHDIEGVPMRMLAGQWGVPLFTAYTRVRAARKAFAAAVSEAEQTRGVNRRRSLGRRSSALALLPLTLDRPAPAGVQARVRRRLQAWFGPVAEPMHGLDTVGISAGVFAAAAAMVFWLGVINVRAGSSRPEAVGDSAERSATMTAETASTRARLLRPPMFVTESPLPAVAQNDLVSGLEPGLVGRWSFTAGARLRDDSGNGRDCVERTSDGAQPGASPGGDDGIVQFKRHGWLECPQPDVGAGDSLEMTVATRFRSSDLPRNHRAVVSRAMEGGAGELFLLGFGGSKLILRSSPWRAKIVHPFPEAAARWVHLAFTHHRDGTTRLFIDGREVGSAWGQPQTAPAVRTPLIVGAGVKRRTTAGNHPMHQFWGGIDDVRVYDRALSVDEIAALAETTSVLAEAPVSAAR